MGLRSWTILAAALSLGGCNMVVSERSLFTEADTRETPVFRAGLWAKDDPDCPFDPTKPLAEWPECANGSAAAEGRGVFRTPDGEILIAAGDPLVVQIRPAKDGLMAPYVYGAVIPVAWDEQKRVTGVEAWLVQCGPPPPRPKGGDGPPDPSAFVTRKPLPGLKIDGANCIASDPQVVRKAAAKSRRWVDGPQRSRWIRDGDH